MSGLPEGLITNTNAITEDIQRVDRVADEDIAQLWRGSRFLSPPGLILNLPSILNQPEATCQQYWNKTGEPVLEDME